MKPGTLALASRRLLKPVPFLLFAAAAALSGCVPEIQQHEIASIHAVGITGGHSARDETHQQIESILDGLSRLFRKRGFSAPLESWARNHGKRYEYGYYLSGERIYGNSYVYSGVKDTIVQCTVSIDRQKASLQFTEMEYPRKSGRFPMPESQRKHVRDTARIVADYLRQRVPTHEVQVSIDFGPPHVTKF